jgi:enterobacterial common antigen flippase
MPPDPRAMMRSVSSSLGRRTAADVTSAENRSYGEILKSSAMIASSSVLGLGIGIIRTKAMALILGPAGVGLIGVYASLADLARSVAELGINSSGVRQIADAVGSGDGDRIGRIVIVLRRTALVLGILGALLLVAVSVPASVLTFGTQEHAGAVALLSLAVLFRLVADGQGALIQGMRRISDLAKVGVLGALFGTLIGVPIVYVLREDGVVPSLVAVAATSLAVSWYYSRKAPIRHPTMTASHVTQEAAALLKLGLAFMASGFLMMGAAYAVRIMVLRGVGLDAAGLYQSAWTLAGLYVGFILQAMGADFYPRLVGVAKDNPQCNRLVNEQAQVSLLLAGPGVIATLTFTPLVIVLFYSAEFSAAVEVLRWICLGMTLRVVTWPMGYIIVAKGLQSLFFATELAWTIVNVALAWLCVRAWGLNGAGIAFFGSYVFHAVMIYALVHRLSGFRWSWDNRRTVTLYILSVAIVFCAYYVLPSPWAMALGAMVMVLSGIHSLRTLVTLFPRTRIPRPIVRLLALFNRHARSS